MTELEFCESWETKSVAVIVPNSDYLSYLIPLRSYENQACLSEIRSSNLESPCDPVGQGMTRCWPAPVMQEGLELGVLRLASEMPGHFGVRSDCICE